MRLAPSAIATCSTTAHCTSRGSTTTAAANGCRWCTARSRELTAERGFASQADVVLRCREAADRLGATPLDRPEDVAVNPLTGNVYFSCTQNLARDEGVVAIGGRTLDTRTDRTSPRAPNTAGHIIEVIEQAADAAATSFKWEIFLLAGAPNARQLVAALPPEHAGSLAADFTYFGWRDGVRRPQRVRKSRQLGLRRRRQSVDRHRRQSTRRLQRRLLRVSDGWARSWKASGSS